MSKHWCELCNGDILIYYDYATGQRIPARPITLNRVAERCPNYEREVAQARAAAEADHTESVFPRSQRAREARLAPPPAWATEANPELVTAEQRAQRLADELKRGANVSCIVTGGLGTGKTTLCAALAADLVAAGRTVVMSDENELLARLRPGGGDAHDPEGIIRLLIALDVLIIDDVGRASQTDWVGSTLFRIVNGRYGEKRPTIITSNWTVKALSESPAWGPLVSRLLDDGGRTITLRGSDLRQVNRPRAVA